LWPNVEMISERSAIVGDHQRSFARVPPISP
jgi:hypothetical protein